MKIKSAQQIVKFGNPMCCKPLRSNIRSVLKDGFIPPPYRVEYDKETGLLEPVKLVEKVDAPFLPLFPRLVGKDFEPQHGFKKMPYDFYCESVQSDIKDRICGTCHTYFATKTALKEHIRSSKQKMFQENCVAYHKIDYHKLIKKYHGKNYVN